MKNTFNEQNQMAKLFAVWYEWLSGARFLFNCYRHWSTLVLSYNNGTADFLYIKEGVSQQGDFLSLLFGHSIGILPLIRLHKVDFSAVE